MESPQDSPRPENPPGPGKSGDWQMLCLAVPGLLLGPPCCSPSSADQMPSAEVPSTLPSSGRAPTSTPDPRARRAQAVGDEWAFAGLRRGGGRRRLGGVCRLIYSPSSLPALLPTRPYWGFSIVSIFIAQSRWDNGKARNSLEDIHVKMTGRSPAPG